MARGPQAALLAVLDKIVDDYGEPITVHAFAAIGKELDQLYAQLDARGLPAGSTAARRLFSG